MSRPDEAALAPAAAPMLAALELLHPAGAAPVHAVLDGTAAPIADGAPLALALVVPGAGPGPVSWETAALARVAQELAADGLVYVLGPRAARARWQRGLAERGFVAAATLAHLPSLARTRHLVPLDPALLRFTADQLTGSRTRRMLLRGALLLPGAALVLEAAGAGIGLVLRRAGARPLGAWLGEVAGPGDAIGGRCIVSPSWRGAAGATLLRWFPAGSGEPTLVAKVAPPAGAAVSGGVACETERLATLGPAATSAGARVPALRWSGALGRRAALVESALPGRSAAALLAAEPRRLDAVIRRVADWLLAWNRATRVVHPLDRATLERELLDPAASLAARLPAGARYRAWLEQRFAPLLDTPVPRVAIHGDLTMANVLWREAGPPGIVDWEESSAEGLPLGDLAYAAVDALTATRADGDRVAAFDETFATGGPPARRLAARVADAARALDLATGPAIELCLHAVWLHHARNETRRGGERGHFLGIVARIAADPENAFGALGRTTAVPA